MHLIHNSKTQLQHFTQLRSPGMQSYKTFLCIGWFKRFLSALHVKLDVVAIQYCRNDKEGIPTYSPPLLCL